MQHAFVAQARGCVFEAALRLVDQTYFSTEEGIDCTCAAQRPADNHGRARYEHFLKCSLFWRRVDSSPAKIQGSRTTFEEPGRAASSLWPRMSGAKTPKSLFSPHICTLTYWPCWPFRAPRAVVPRLGHPPGRPGRTPAAARDPDAATILLSRRPTMPLLDTTSRLTALSLPCYLPCIGVLSAYLPMLVLCVKHARHPCNSVRVC